MSDKLPRPNPTTILGIDNNVLKASFVCLIFFCIVSIRKLAFVSCICIGPVDVLLLHFIFIIEEFYQEVRFILHLLDMSSQLAPILSCFLPLRFGKWLLTTNTILRIIFLILFLIKRRGFEITVVFVNLLVVILSLNTTTHVTVFFFAMAFIATSMAMPMVATLFFSITWFLPTTIMMAGFIIHLF